MSDTPYDWAVIGAGPAGILAIGKLIDHGIEPAKIVWVDPQFNAGDIGQYWHNVPSNTKVRLFHQFMSCCRAFNNSKPAQQYPLDSLMPDTTCLLGELITPLTHITRQLCEQVNPHRDHIKTLSFHNNQWHLQRDNTSLIASNVILATGATPKSLNYPQMTAIDLMTALNPTRLKSAINPDDNVAVFGASHSGVLVLKNLLDLGCHVTHFYKHAIRYAIPREHDIIYDNTGLKGTAATWAKQHLHGQAHPKLTRHLISNDAIDDQLAPCNKAVYAIGFTPRIPQILDVNAHDYDPHTGIIAPGLFGLGIAFPESVTSAFGHTEASVGMAKFVNYINKVMPLWLAYAG